MSLRDLIRGSWPKWTSVLRDVGLAVAFLIMSSIILAGVSHLLHASNSEVASRVLPRTPAEISAYLLLCATAGFCEEIIFRGFLFKVLFDIGGPGIAVSVTAILFALLHLPQLWGSWAGVVLIFVVGYVLSYVRLRANSLIPSFIIHTSYNAMLFGVFALSTFVQKGAH